MQQYRSSGVYPSSSGVVSNGLASYPSPKSQSVPYATAPQYTTAAPVATTAAPVATMTMPSVQTLTGTVSSEMYNEVKSPVTVSSSRGVPVTATTSPAGYLSREQVLEKKVRDLEALVSSKDERIRELQAALTSAKNSSSQKENGGNNNSKSKARSPGRTGSGFRKLSASKPSVRYQAADQDDPIDVRLEEFYNSTGSSVPFHRINRGFYRFGETIVEVDIINHKLMARTEDGWNRGKFGPVEKFLGFYENIEREKAGILPES